MSILPPAAGTTGVSVVYLLIGSPRNPRSHCDCPQVLSLISCLSRPRCPAAVPREVPEFWIPSVERSISRARSEVFQEISKSIVALPAFAYRDARIRGVRPTGDHRVPTVPSTRSSDNPILVAATVAVSQVSPNRSRNLGRAESPESISVHISSVCVFRTGLLLPP